jgi:hypothetical protein
MAMLTLSNKRETRLHARIDLQAGVLGHLGALIPGHRPAEFFGQGDDRARDGDANRLAPWPASAGPFFIRGALPCPAMRGRCSSIVNRVVRSTRVPIAELPSPRMRSPSQLPGTARSVASAGRWAIMISGEMKVLPRLRVRALSTRNVRPVRKQAVSSRRSAARPWTNSA